MRCLYLLVLSYTVLHLGICARILGLFTTPSVSHQAGFQAIWKHLVLNSHDVTVISPNVLNDTTLKNLKEINISQVYEIIKVVNWSKFSRTAFNLEKMFAYFDLVGTAAEIALDDKEVKALFKSNEEFDVLIVQAIHPLVFSVAAKFRVPVIGELLAF